MRAPRPRGDGLGGAVHGREVERMPVDMHVGAGTVAVLAAVTVAATLPASQVAWRLVPVAITLAAVGVYTVDPVAVTVVTILACPLVIGFLVNQHGVLSWHDPFDTYRLLALAVCAGAGLLAGSARRRRRGTGPLIVPPGRS